MLTKIRKVGSSMVVTIPTEIVTEMHLEEGTKVKVERDGRSITIKPETPASLDDLFKDWHDTYAKEKPWKEMDAPMGKEII